MNSLVSLAPEIEEELTVIVSRYPKDGLANLLTLMSAVIDAIRRRLRNQSVDGWDRDSVRAIDEFITHRDSSLMADDDKIYFVAEHGRVGSAIMITRAGVYENINT